MPPAVSTRISKPIPRRNGFVTSAGAADRVVSASTLRRDQITIGGMPDHVHLLTRVPTNLTVADAVRAVKANSSKWINERVSNMKFGWQRGYGAFSVSHSDMPRVIDYIRNQYRHHRVRSFKEELELLLTRHEIDFDRRHLC